MKSLTKISIALTFLWLASCGNSSFVQYNDSDKTLNPSQTQVPVSPNDMAFLFPLDDSGRPVPFVTLANEPNIPGPGNFDRVMDAASNEGVSMIPAVTDADNWVMVSFRYIPCSLFVGTPNPCKEQMRFVYQPRDLNTGVFLDFSLHVTYEFNAADTAQSSAVLTSVLNLRDKSEGATENVPLGVHPVLADGSNSRAYASDIRDLLWRPHIFDRNPKAITFMGLGVAPGGGTNLGEWRFFFGAVDQSGAWSLQNLPDGSGDQVEVLGIHDDGPGNPMNRNGNIFSSITDQTEFNILAGNGATERQAAAALLPHVTNEHNINCASCHTVDNSIIRDTPGRLVDIQTFNYDQFATNIVNFLADDDDIDGFNNYLIDNNLRGGFFSNAAGIPTVPPSPAPEDEVVTRMFGYMHNQPVISQRMVFDNTKAVNDANRLLGQTAVNAQNNGPNNSCSVLDEQVAVMTCMFTGGFETTVRECVRQACE